jgi:hypothetical protein
MVLLPCGKCCRAYGAVVTGCTGSLSIYNLASAYATEFPVGETYPAYGSPNNNTGTVWFWHWSYYHLFWDAWIQLKCVGGYIYCRARLEARYGNNYSAQVSIDVEFQKQFQGEFNWDAKLEFTSADIISWNSTKTNTLGNDLYRHTFFGFNMKMPTPSQEEFGKLTVGAIPKMETVEAEWAVTVTLCYTEYHHHTYEDTSGIQFQGEVPFYFGEFNNNYYTSAQYLPASCKNWSITASEFDLAQGSSAWYYPALRIWVTGEEDFAYIQYHKNEWYLPLTCDNITIDPTLRRCSPLEGLYGALEFFCQVSHPAWELLRVGNTATIVLPEPRFTVTDPSQSQTYFDWYYMRGFNRHPFKESGSVLEVRTTSPWISFGDATLVITRVSG